MALTETFQRWIAEPPPEHIFEITERGLAQASPKDATVARLEAVAEQALVPSPSAANFVRHQSYRDALERLAGPPTPRRGTAALVIPDYAVRMAVLDFQEFPNAEPDRIALLRFRLRKSVPFHIEEAQVSYAIQLQEPKHIEVLAVAIARPILEEYETLLADHGYRVGLVTPSSLAAATLFAGSANAAQLTLVAKSAGSAVSVLLVQQGRLRLVRSLNLSLAEHGAAERTVDAVLAVVQQTIAYAEDQIGSPVSRILLCGFESETEFVAAAVQREFDIAAAPVSSRLGRASQENAGLLGLLEQYTA